MMNFKALRVPTLTEEMALRLENVLDELPGIEQFVIGLETRELDIIFDENLLGFPTLVKAMAGAGCSLRHIEAAVLLNLPLPCHPSDPA